MMLQPTSRQSATQPKIPTYALLPGDYVWTARGPREVLRVQSGAAGGWRHVIFDDGLASVVFTHPWEAALMCSANVGGDPGNGCEEWALVDSDYCAGHHSLEDE